MKIIFVLYALMFLGCTQIKVYGDKPTIDYVFGVPHITFDTTSAISLYNVRSLGVGSYNTGMTIGYAGISRLDVRDLSQCFVIILVSTEDEFRKIEENVKSTGNHLNNICLVLNSAEHAHIRK